MSPLQTPARKLLSKTLSPAPSQVEDGTPFGRWYPPGHAALPDDEDGAAMYRDASHMLREVSVTLTAAQLPTCPWWSAAMHMRTGG